MPRVRVWIDDVRIGYLQDIRLTLTAGDPPHIELTQILPPDHAKAQDLRHLAKLFPWADLYTQLGPGAARALIRTRKGPPVTFWKMLMEDDT